MTHSLRCWAGEVPDAESPTFNLVMPVGLRQHHNKVFTGWDASGLERKSAKLSGLWVSGSQAPHGLHLTFALKHLHLFLSFEAFPTHLLHHLQMRFAIITCSQGTNPLHILRTLLQFSVGLLPGAEPCVLKLLSFHLYPPPQR